MKADVIRGKDATACAGIGVGGAIVFLFAFPKGAISTLIHEVLHLPGPGAGIALVVGPFLIVVAILSALRSRGLGGAVTAALTFAVVHTLAAKLLGMSSDSKGAFGSGMFVLAVVACGMAAEAGMVLGRGLRAAWRCAIAGASANGFLLLFYWVLIFPRTAGWIRYGDIPLLMGLGLVAGLVSGCLACAVSRSLSRILAPQQQGADHVRPRGL